jgi:hypothetical protein
MLRLIALVFAAGCATAPEGDVEIANDRLFGDCKGDAILEDYFERVPPSAGKFSVEIDLDKSANEIFVFYGGMPPGYAKTAYYDASDCRFLRLEDGEPHIGNDNE